MISDSNGKTRFFYSRQASFQSKGHGRSLKCAPVSCSGRNCVLLPPIILAQTRVFPFDQKHRSNVRLSPVHLHMVFSSEY